MGAMSFLRTLNLTGWLTAFLIALLLLTAGSCVWMARQDATERRKTTEAHKTLAEGRTAAAGDASAIRDRADARDDQITATTQEATDAIRSAPDDDAAAAAALRGLCRLYPDRDARCRVLQPRP